MWILKIGKLHEYICMWIFKLVGWYLAGCIYMYVWRFLKLANLSKLIFGRLFLPKKRKMVGSIYMCVCVCVDHQSWQVECIDIWQDISINMHVDFTFDIWQVWWNIYVCGFLKLASLSTLIFGKFFLKKKKKNW